MATKTYAEKLKDPRWQRKRLEILERDIWMCSNCGDNEKTLHVHHRLYDKKYSDPWDYPSELLITLCEDCHKSESQEDWDRVMKTLEAALKKNFFANDIDHIAYGFENYTLPHLSSVGASSIEFALSNEEISTELVTRYFAFLQEKSGSKYLTFE
jgi:hypothetical protein